MINVGKRFPGDFFCVSQYFWLSRKAFFVVVREPAKKLVKKKRNFEEEK